MASGARACLPGHLTVDRLRELARAGWQWNDAGGRAETALAVLPCLASSDAELRDDLAIGLLTAWLRAEALDADTMRTIGSRTLARLTEPDADGFGPPFAALALAEVARADRRRPLWGPTERDAVLQAAARFVAGVRDYRGFDPAQGWRHGVAHGADLLMQLALNPALDRAQLDLVLQAVAAQATPAAHFYVHGEGERLARPVIAVARRGLHSADEWTSWFGAIAVAGMTEPGAPTTLQALARQHNAKAFLLPLYAGLMEGSDEALRQRLRPALAAALRTLWR